MGRRPQSVEGQIQSYEAARHEAERCEGRYPVPGPRDEPFDVTYRCYLPEGHDGPHRGGYPGEEDVMGSPNIPSATEKQEQAKAIGEAIRLLHRAGWHEYAKRIANDARESGICVDDGKRLVRSTDELAALRARLTTTEPGQ